MVDVIVIGKGPAGLSSSLYLARAGYNVLVIGKEGSLSKAHLIENYLGIESIKGEDFLKIATEQVKKIGVNVIDDKVLEATMIEEDGKILFKVITANSSYTSTALILAIGNGQKAQKIENEDKFLGSGVSYCVACDGFFYKNKTVGVVGNNENVLLKASELSNFTKDVIIFTNGKEIEANQKYINRQNEYIIKKSKIVKLDGDSRLQKVVLENGEYVNLNGLFIANETANATDFEKTLGIYVNGNKIVVDKDYMTNVSGVFACGDITNDFMQLSTAVGSSANAAKSCIKYLIEQKVKK